MSQRHRQLKRRRYYIKFGRTFGDGTRVTYWPDGQLKSRASAEYFRKLDEMIRERYPIYGNGTQ